MCTAIKTQSADAPHWHDSRAELPDADTLVRVIAHQEGTDYLDMFDAALVAKRESGRHVWRDECGSLYAHFEILAWRDLTTSESE